MLTWVMRLTLLLPGLLWPRQALRDTVLDLAAPALCRLLGRGDLRPGPAQKPLDWLVAACGLEQRPFAALRLLGEGGDPGGGHWLCLDPLHLRREEWALVADDPQRLGLTEDEDAALRAVAAPFFAHWGRLSARRPGRWYLECAAPPAMFAPPLPDILGRPMDPQLPEGSEGALWRRQLALVQPLLHEHPANRARQAAGRPLVNCLWPWGEGCLQGKVCPPWKCLVGDDPLLAGLAAAAGARYQMRPDSFAPTADDTLVVLDDLSVAAQSLDALAWREMLTALERNWFAPALDSLTRGHLKELRLLGFGDEGSLELALTPWKAHRFWRRPLPLTELAP